ncbi:hypothetical protein E2F50_19335 [Rhizobium deserti]|uniref:Uncharacterized protein n=1 Tax=Rhizobium deserti TaxID=2547961 RepID=A0A4R5UAF9_9HYPH|nr:hypothetical protein [Rhizobium deserti]TDK31817.1 hypothetical protein E2F50_19335 [Rhizobium deserti]
MTTQTMPPTDPTPSFRPVARTTARACEFELRVFSKYDDATVDATGPTLGIAISHSLPELRHLGHPRTVFGARPFKSGRSSYGAWEIVFPVDEARPGEGYDQFGIRHAVSFEDSIEVFDVYRELKEYEGVLRYRAQDLGDDEKARQIIAEGVARYVSAARHAMLWDPKCKLNIPKELDKLFLDRDWSPYISREELIAPACIIEDVRIIGRRGETECVVRFMYRNGDKHGFDLEFVDMKRGKPKIRRDAFSALRSPVPIFRGDQLPAVYEKLQAAVDALDFARPQKKAE